VSQGQVKNAGRTLPGGAAGASQCHRQRNTGAVLFASPRPDSLPVIRPRGPADPSASAISSLRAAMRAILDIILIVLDIYVWLLIASAILSWLVAFNVVNTRNPVVSNIGEFLYRITEPLLRPIRNFLPNFGGLDISPIILILVIMLIQRVITYYIYPNVF
jgi:YggT family protein